MFKERMTPEELANLTGYSRQTINKWVRKEGWATSPKPGVQGGKARLVHVTNKFVNTFAALSVQPKVYQITYRYPAIPPLKRC